MLKKQILIITLVTVLMICAGIVQAFEMEVPEGRQYDFEGETIILPAMNMYPDLGSVPMKEYFEEPQNKDHLEWVENTFNCKIKFTDRYENESPGHTEEGRPTHLMADIIAGDVPSHVLNMPAARTIGRSVPEGIFHTLDDYLDEEYYQGKTFIESLPAPHRNIRLKVADKTYSFFGNIGGIHAPVMMAINLDMLARNGIDPDSFLEMVDQREWTWDAFRDITLSVSKDTDGDGELDEGAFLMNSRNMEMWVATNGATFIEEEDGKLVENITGKDVQESFEFLGDLFQELGGIPAVDDADFKWTQQKPFDWTDGKSLWEFSHIAINQARNDNIDFNWTLVPFPMGPNVDEYQVPGDESMMQFLPITLQNPRAVMEVVVALNRATAPYRDLDNFESEYREKMIYGVPDRNSVKWLEWASEQERHIRMWNAVIEDIQAVEGEEEYTMSAIWTEIIKRGESVSRLDMFESAMQTFIDETFGQ